MSDRLIFVSCDSHAGVPKELWSEYLDPKFHEHLTKLKVDTEIYPTAIFMLGAKSKSTSLPEVQRGAQRRLAWPLRRGPAARRHGP